MVGIEFFTENDLKFLIGIGISIFAGFLVGIERETKNKPTGIGYYYTSSCRCNGIHSSFKYCRFIPLV